MLDRIIFDVTWFDSDRGVKPVNVLVSIFFSCIQEMILWMNDKPQGVGGV